MLKKIILGCLSVLIASPVFAATMKVQAVDSFSTENPIDKFSVRVLSDCTLSDDLTFHEGDIVSGKTTEIVSPKRLKRDATFSIILESYTDTNGEYHEIKEEIKGKYSSLIDKKEIAKTAGLAIGSYFVTGLSLGVNAIEGAVKNEEGNRLKSSAKNMYEKSPFSYVETGEELNIERGDIFNLKFHTSKDNDDALNYEYTIPEES